MFFFSFFFYDTGITSQLVYTCINRVIRGLNFVIGFFSVENNGSPDIVATFQKLVHEIL